MIRSLFAFATFLVLVTGAALAREAPLPAAETRFFDAATKQWVALGPRVAVPGRPGGASPIPREVVSYDGPHPANTVIVDTTERRLYYTLGDGKAIRYGVGVGREGFQFAGSYRVTRKAEWPTWTPPPQMIRREPWLVKYAGGMPGGPNNPLGARALYIGSTLYRIHGSNEPWTIGQAVSSGCIRMANDDVIHLYNLVDVGTRVVVTR